MLASAVSLSSRFALLCFDFFVSLFEKETKGREEGYRVLKCGGSMGDCEKDLDFFKPPQPEEEEEKQKKKEEITCSSSHASDDDDHHHATNIETLVGDLQKLCLEGNENNNNQNQIDDNPDASDQDDPTTTIETLEGEEFQNQGSGNQNDKQVASDDHDSSTATTTTPTTTEGRNLFWRPNFFSSTKKLISLLSLSQTNRPTETPPQSLHQSPTIHLAKENPQPPADLPIYILSLPQYPSNQTSCGSTETTTTENDLRSSPLARRLSSTIETTTLDGELPNLSSEGKENQRDKPSDYIKTLDEELHNPEVETNPSSEWDKLHNPEVDTNPSSEWDDGWFGTQKDNPEVETNLSSEWDGTQKDKPEGETIFKEEKRRIFQYPLRPEEPDCVFYLRTGSCRYGFHCKFNHPPRKKHQLKASSHLSDSSVQRVEPIPAIEVVKEKETEREDYSEWTGKIECKYYRTPGGCKFGKACRYYHPREKNVIGPPTEFNFLGLPIRPGEKKCPFFMRTGSCKFATSCRFHHPDPTDAVESDPLSGYYDAESVELHSEGSPQPPLTSWSLPGTYNETAPYMDTSSSYPTGMVSPSQAHHNQEWNGYQVSVRYSPEGNRNPQSASLMNHSTRKDNNSMYQQQQMVVDKFPERPGQHECQYYMKHGDCKYRSACRFHHPKNYSTNSPALSSIGLPLRPDQIICSNYSRFGICKYGPACKYDHPA